MGGWLDEKEVFLTPSYIFPYVKQLCGVMTGLSQGREFCPEKVAAECLEGVGWQPSVSRRRVVLVHRGVALGNLGQTSELNSQAAA